jgi:predicted metal-binding protein
MAELVDKAVKVYELLAPGSIIERFNELVNEYESVLLTKVKISVPALRRVQINPRKFKKLVTHPLPHCKEEDWEFNEVNFGTGKTICLTNITHGRERCYPAEISILNLLELTCNIADILESLKSDIEKAVNELPKIIETLKTIIAESKLFS